MKLINKFAFLLLFANASTSWAFEVNCYSLERGEAVQKQSPRFTKKRGCDVTNEQCDMHRQLGVMRHQFDAQLTNNMLAAFDQCRAEVLSANTSSSQRKAATLDKNKQAFIAAPNNIQQLSNQVEEGNQLLKQLLQALDEYERLSNTIGDKLVDTASINRLIQKSGEVSSLSQSLDAFHTKYKLRDNEFYPSIYYDVQARISNTKDAVGNAINQPLSALESDIYAFRKEYSRLEYDGGWSSEKLVQYKEDAAQVLSSYRSFVEAFSSVIDAASKDTQERVANAQVFANRIRDSLLGIEEAISTSQEREAAKQIKDEKAQMFRDSLSTRNMVLVASQLGYGNGFLDDYFPFYMYLGCLSEKYSNYLFQGYAVKNSDGSRNLVIKLYSGDNASDDSLAVHLEFTQVIEGRYVTVKADEYESGFDKAGQNYEVLVGTIKQCQQKYNL